MVNWNKMATIIIALVVLFLIALWQFGPEGLFGGIKKAVDKVSGVVKIGAEEVEATTPTIPAEHEAAIKKLVDTMQKMINSDKKNCFLNYGGLPDLGEQGTAIVFKKDSIEIENGGRILVNLSQELSKKIKGFSPCVIAGTETLTENFVDHFFKGIELKTPYYQSVKEIKISNIGSNHIGVSDFRTDVVNDEKNNFEDNGWLVITENNHICFLPTNYYSDDEDGIDNDYLEQGAVIIC